MLKTKYILGLSLTTILLLNGCGGDGNSQKTQQKQITFLNQDSYSVPEGTKNIIPLKTDVSEHITYAIVGGEDADKFQIDPQNGTLRFTSLPDYEDPLDSDHDNSYIVTIQASADNGASVTKTFTVHITDDTQDNGPVFTSQNSIETTEERPLDFQVSASNAVKYEIVGGADKTRFVIDTDGKLHYLHFLPDYEQSSDANHDNRYELQIKAIDGNNNASLQNLTIIITDDPSDNDNTSTHRYVFKTGQNDGPGIAGTPFGDDRNFTARATGNQRYIIAGDRQWEDSGHSKLTKLTYDEALNYCATLKQEKYAGIDTWRLPLRHEMYEIINYDKNPSIDDVFINKTNGSYWTSQALINYKGQVLANQAFAISFQNGVSYAEDMNKTLYVRCVAGARYQEPPLLKQDANGIYTDTSTSLQWAKDAADNNHTWADEKKRCEMLVLNGKKDWRLPNITELHTIMPIYNEEFLLDANGDGNPDLRGPFWSSTKLDQTHIRYIENYWNADRWAVDQNESNRTHKPIGRDVLNDDSESNTTNDLGSICVRGGHL